MTFCDLIMQIIKCKPIQKQIKLIPCVHKKLPRIWCKLTKSIPYRIFNIHVGHLIYKIHLYSILTILMLITQTHKILKFIFIQLEI